MNKLFLVALAPLLLASCNKEETLPKSEIPAEISGYVSTHFPGAKIIGATKDIDGWDLTYDITLEGGYFLEFNRKKELTDIEGLSKLPESIIPGKIGSFISSNYTENQIVGWEIDNRHQQIKLDNRLELEFNMDGDFLRIDN